MIAPKVIARPDKPVAIPYYFWGNHRAGICAMQLLIGAWQKAVKKLGISRHQILSVWVKRSLELTMMIITIEQALSILSGYIIRCNRALNIAIGTNMKLNMSVCDVITTGSTSIAFEISITIVERAQMYIALAILLQSKQPRITHL